MLPAQKAVTGVAATTDPTPLPDPEPVPDPAPTLPLATLLEVEMGERVLPATTLPPTAVAVFFIKLLLRNRSAAAVAATSANVEFVVGIILDLLAFRHRSRKL